MYDAMILSFTFLRLLTHTLIGTHTHRIGKGSDQVWYHDNFLRGKPECLKNMIRTKIKGDKSTVGQDVRVPNLEELPPLPILCNKLPSPEVLEVMKHVILSSKLPPPPPTCIQSAPCSAVNNVCSSTQPLPTLMNVESMPTLVSLPRIVNNSVLTSMMDFTTPQSFSIPTHDADYAPPPFLRRKVSDENSPPPCHHQDQNDITMLSQQVHSTMSLSMMRQQLSLPQDPSQMEPNCFVSSNNDNLNLCCSEHSSNLHFSNYYKNDFEPLSFMNDDEPCDEFASFIEGAIQQI